MLKRGGEVRALVVEDRKKRTLQTEVKKHVAAGSALFSDELLSYDGLEALYAHEVITHAVQYVDGNVHTNGMENFWSLLKRCLGGTYVSVGAVPPVPVSGRTGVPLQRAGREGLRAVSSRPDSDRRSPPDVRRVDWEAGSSRCAGLTAARISAARSAGNEKIAVSESLKRWAATGPSSQSVIVFPAICPIAQSS